MAQKKKKEDPWRLVLQMSNKGGVGKTKWSDLHLSWADYNNMKVSGIDPDSGNLTFLRRRPDLVTQIDIEDRQDRDDMDKILTGKFGEVDLVTVDGMPAQRKQWVDWIEGMDLFDYLEEINLGLTFVVNIIEDYDCCEQAIMIMERFKDAPVDWLLVKNHYTSNHTKLWDNKTNGPEVAKNVGAYEFVIDNLPTHIGSKLSAYDLSVYKGIEDERIDWMNRNRLRKWVNTHFKRLDSINHILGGDTKSGSIAFSS